MRYGYFDQPNQEYVITRPDTPRPWSNYIGDAEFGGVITNHGTGYTFYKSAAQGRLTRFQFNAVPGQFHGRHIYIRDNATGSFWANGWMPVDIPPEELEFECRHGTGYTRIQSTRDHLRTTMTCFVPLGARHEVWSIEVSNLDRLPRNISLFPFIEPQCNWNAGDDMMNLQYTQYISLAGCPQPGLLDLGHNVNMPEDPANFTNKDQNRHSFFGLAGATAAAYDCDLTTFLGPYGTRAAPAAVRQGHCSNSDCSGDMPCAVFQIDLELAPGETRNVALAFGVGSAMDAGVRAQQQLSDPAYVQKALSAVKAHWQSRLSTLQVETPDHAFDAMANLWAPYNNLITFYWSRAASLVYAGERDGLGYRDTVQDFVGSAALIPGETRDRLELMLTGQYAHGGCKPVVQPFAHRPGHEAEPDEYRSDDGMWLFMAVPTYVKESGDLAFYDHLLPYADRGQGSVLQHLRAAIQFNLDRCGQHGLPCGLKADWNDCIRLGATGETVFVALQLRYALKTYLEITTRLDRPTETAWATDQLKILDANLDRHAWDGEWYLRAYRFDGTPFGSRHNTEGSIFMNPQTWAVLSHHAEGERARQVLDAMHEHLNTDYGIMVCTPPYLTTDPEVCLARLMNPGMKENGAVFNHTQGWAVMAAAEVGLGDRAYTYLKQVMPARFNDCAEIREVEPYAVCQSTHSRFSPRFGAGRIPWLSGSAVWNYVAMTTAILGIQPDYDGLRINPCLPSDWPEYRAIRRFRGATYHIRVLNPDGLCTGVHELSVDGKRAQGNLIPVASPGSEVHVETTLKAL